ncbi:ATP-binding cassette domain-containing protein [Lapidilactobacillus luobeiensis]|uniref:ATP-binding cassette domain-containing protein n=1 Tax=Lapidilactobacillus luobeiensis TaxID=2950371 RepID=UPI0021C2BAE9|nr:ABC transporter ATP-binding protein [Lapidilactobacillus luobeiensis]
MIIIKDVDLAFGNDILLRSGQMRIDQQIYGLVATNGSGKTTLLRTIAGLLPLKSGEIYLTADQTNERLPTLTKKKNLFYFETGEWFDGNLTAADYLKFVAKQWQGNSQLIEKAVDFWEMRPFLRRPIRKYSLGMKQKTVLALYYVANTPYWLMDEPTLGLDLDSQARFISFMKAAKQRGTSILFSSHQNDSLLSVADTFYILDKQQLVASAELPREWGERG